MSNFFKKITSSYNTIVLTSGLMGYSYLIYNKLRIDSKLTQPVIQEVLDQLKNNKEVTETVGNQFVVTTGLFKSLYIKAQETNDSMEYSFSISGTKGNNLNVYFSALAKQHKDIKNSQDWESLETDYYIPPKNVSRIIDEADNKDHLKNLILDDRTKFWKIEYIEGIRESNGIIDIKDPVSAVLYAPKIKKRETYLDIYQNLKVT